MNLPSVALPALRLPSFDRRHWLATFVLVVFVVLTPLTVVWQWPSWISAVLLFAIIGLLHYARQRGTDFDPTVN